METVKAFYYNVIITLLVRTDVHVDTVGVWQELKRIECLYEKGNEIEGSESTGVDYADFKNNEMSKITIQNDIGLELNPEIHRIKLAEKLYAIDSIQESPAIGNIKVIECIIRRINN